MLKLYSIVLLILSCKIFSFTMNDYMQLMEQNNISNIDEAIGILPIDFRQHFALIYEGHGLRGTSFSRPAAILFDPYGSFFVNSGHPLMGLGDQIEVAEVNL
jgi:hypothetical protein